MSWVATVKRSVGDYGLASDQNNCMDRFDTITPDGVNTPLIPAAGTIGSSQIVDNSITYADIGADAVHQSELATTPVTGTVSSPVGSAGTASGYRTIGSAFALQVGSYLSTAFVSCSFITRPQNYDSYPGNGSKQWEIYYELAHPVLGSAAVGSWEALGVSASPPHQFAGSDDWGLFLFVIRDIESGEIRETWSSEDPPWLNQASWPKDHPALPAGRPHPFASILQGSEALADGCEIVLIDLRPLATMAVFKPAAMAYANIIADRQKFVEMGIDAKAIETAEKHARIALEIEAAEIREAELRMQAAEEAFQRFLVNRAVQPEVITAVNHRNLPSFQNIKAVNNHERQALCFKYAVAKKKRDGVHASEKVRARQFPKWKQIDLVERARGGNIHTAIREGRILEVSNATHELPGFERKKLPTGERFTSSVRVVQAR